MPINKFGKKKSDVPLTRTKYEDPSKKFLDWVHHIGLDKSFVRRFFIELEEKFYFSRFLIVFSFCVVLSYFILLQIELPYDFKVGDVAKLDIISSIGFEMVDEVTTEEKRSKAEALVPIVFDYDVSTFEKVSTGVYKAFRQMRGLLHEQPWFRGEAPGLKQIAEFSKHKSTFEQLLGAPVPLHTFEWLVENRFNSHIEGVLLRNLERWYEKKIVDSPERNIPQNHTSVVVRILSRNKVVKEFTIPKSELVDIQIPTNFEMEFQKGLDLFREVDKTNLTQFARSLLSPNLSLNLESSSQRKQQARDGILPITITIKKNQTIVSRDSTVQPFQMAIIKQIESIQSDRKKDLTQISLAILLFVCVLVFNTYLDRFSVYKMQVESKDLYVMMFISLGLVLLVKLFLFIFDAAFVVRLGSLIPRGVLIYAVPAAAGTMLAGLLIKSGEIVWLFNSFVAISLGIMVDFNFTFTLMIWLGGMAAARGVHNCKTRNDIYFAGLRTGIVNAFLIATILTVFKSDQDFFYKEIIMASVGGFLGGILSSIIAMIFVPLLESIFNYTTDVKLLELSNLNHPLLKEMIIKAPGTYHHSMMVGSMVEAAAEDIGANPLLGKVMCYYHDIGKVEHAQYFIENQKPGINPHDNISPFMSKTLLIAHVKDGVEKGMVYKLGKPIIDGILQHHGTTLISYFFNKAQDENPSEGAEVFDGDFRYPGPKPQFIEAALCMLADSIEAAARSLDEPTPTRLQNIVKNVIQRKFVDGQLDECNLTLRDISKVEASFVRILLGIYHQRIDYPKRAGGGLGDNSQIEPK